MRHVTGTQLEETQFLMSTSWGKRKIKKPHVIGEEKASKNRVILSECLCSNEVETLHSEATGSIEVQV